MDISSHAYHKNQKTLLPDQTQRYFEKGLKLLSQEGKIPLTDGRATMAKEEKKKKQNRSPVKKFWENGVSVAVWKNDKGYSLSIQKSYKDEDGEYQTSESYFPSDALVLAGLLNHAHMWIAEKREQERKDDDEDDDEDEE